MPSPSQHEFGQHAPFLCASASPFPKQRLNTYQPSRDTLGSCPIHWCGILRQHKKTYSLFSVITSRACLRQECTSYLCGTYPKPRGTRLKAFCGVMGSELRPSDRESLRFCFAGLTRHYASLLLTCPAEQRNAL